MIGLSRRPIKPQNCGADNLAQSPQPSQNPPPSYNQVSQAVIGKTARYEFICFKIC